MGFHFTQDLKLNIEISVPKWRMFIALCSCKLTSFCVRRWLLLQVCATSCCHYTSESLQHSLVSIFFVSPPGSDGVRSLFYWGHVTFHCKQFIVLLGTDICFTEIVVFGRYHCLSGVRSLFLSYE